MIDVILAPDVYVNASLAPGTAPDHVVQRVLGRHKGECKVSDWLLSRVEGILKAVPEFRSDAVDQQLALIRSYVQVMPGLNDFGADDWEKALVATAKAAGAKRVITDHPDLLKVETSGGVDFVSSDAWLVEAAMPPPVPPA